MRLLGSSPSPLLVYAALLFSLLVWAGTSIVGKIVVTEFPVFLILFLRFLAASVIILPLLFLHDTVRKTPGPRQYLELFLVCFFGFTLQIALFFLGISRAAILDMSIIVMISPLMVAVVGWWWLGEPHNVRNIAGFILAGFGATLGIALSAGAPGQHSMVGNLLLFAAEVCLVIYIIGSKRLGLYFSPQIIAATSFSIAMLTYGVYVLFDPNSAASLANIPGRVILGLAYLAVISSVLAYTTYEWSLDFLQASKVAALTYIQPLASAALAIIFLGEVLHTGYIIGVCLTMIGIWMALSNPHHRTKKAKEAIHFSRSRHW